MDDAQRLETNFLAWITMSAVFITAAVIIEAHRPNGKKYFVVFFAIGIILLIVTAVDYINEKNALKEKKVRVPGRLNALFIIVLATIVVSLIILYQNFRGLRRKSVMN